MLIIHRMNIRPETVRSPNNDVCILVFFFFANYDSCPVNRYCVYLCRLILVYVNVRPRICCSDIGIGVRSFLYRLSKC
jgi:hypothetical protein